MKYLVRWEIEVEADSALEAAQEAREIQLDPTSTATVFECISNTESIDLVQDE